APRSGAPARRGPRGSFRRARNRTTTTAPPAGAADDPSRRGGGVVGGRVAPRRGLWRGCGRHEWLEARRHRKRGLRGLDARRARVASICSGAFVLAATGALDGLRATTHWRSAPELARRHPEIDVDADVLYVDNGNVLTSAGAAAGFDLCLHLVRRDLGARVASEVARAAVMPLERAGGQAQFIAHEPPTSDGTSIGALLVWLE